MDAAVFRRRQLCALGFGLAFVLTGIVLMVLCFRTIHALGGVMTESVDGAFAERYAFEALVDEETAVRGYAVTRDTLFLKPYERARPVYARFKRDWQTLADARTTRALRSFIRQADAREASFAAQIAAIRAGDAARVARAMPAEKAAFDRFRAADMELALAILASVRSSRVARDAIELVIEVVSFVFGVFLVGGTALTALLLYRARSSALLARSDALTALANRRAFEEELRRVVRRRSTHAAGVLFVDLDRFKAVNDTYGHAAGDTVLTTCAGRIRSAVRPGDFVARLGGDEFAIILRRVGVREEAYAVATRVRTEIARPIVIDGQVVSVDASIGVALAPGDGTDPDTLLGSADSAMYHAKQARFAES